jgi:hypothetical protein
MTHAEEEAKSDNGEQSDHLLLDRSAGARTCASTFQKVLVTVIPSSALADSLNTSVPGRTALNVSSHRYFVKILTALARSDRRTG